MNQLMDHIPMWAFFIGVSLVTLVSQEIGQHLGERRRNAASHEGEGPVSTVVGATIGLLGFMVALTLGASASRLEARREALIDGVNAIETAHRCGGLLPEPHRTEVRRLLSEYVAARIEMPKAFGAPEELRKLDAGIKDLQRSLWSHAEALAAADRNSEVYALFISSLNETFSVYNKRIILGAQHRIPFLVWATLLIVTVFAMVAVGFAFGLTGSRSLVANVALTLTFALVMAVIFDLDQPTKGLIDVSQRPMVELYERLSARS